MSRTKIATDEWFSEMYEPGNEWVPYSGDYEKQPCDIETRNGKTYGPCWPNAGKFNPLLNGNWCINENAVARIRYYTDKP